MYDPTTDDYQDAPQDNRPSPAVSQWLQAAIAALAIAGMILLVAMLAAGCQKIYVTADRGATVRIDGSNSKPISAGVDAALGDSAVRAAGSAIVPHP